MNKITIPKLEHSNRSREFNLYTDEQQNACLFSYLFENKSHRWLDKNVLMLDDVKTKGWQSMGILHFLGVKKEFKGIFESNSLNQALAILRDGGKDYDEIIARLSRHTPDGFPRRFDSWEVISQAHYSKMLDKSSFDYHGSGIPIGMREYFGVNDLDFGETLNVTLLYDNTTYIGKISRETSELGRTRIFWSKELSEILKDRYPEFYEKVSLKEVNSNKRPKIYFENIDKDTYMISLSDKISYKTFKEYISGTEKSVRQSKSDSSAKRKQRIKNAQVKPPSMIVKTTVFKRNPDVIVEVLERADGICERCKKAAPFIRATDNTPYLEVHHIVPLSNGGDDTIENAIGLCPNCHRELHFGMI